MRPLDLNLAKDLNPLLMSWLEGNSHIARQLRCRLGGLHRAAFWRRQGFPNCARARAAWKRERHQLLIEQWKREELQRTRYAMFEDPPSYEELAARFKVSYRELAELRSMKSSRRK